MTGAAIIKMNLCATQNFLYKVKKRSPPRKSCPVVVNVVIIVTTKIMIFNLERLFLMKHSIDKAKHNTILYIGPSLKSPLLRIILKPKRFAS